MQNPRAVLGVRPPMTVPLATTVLVGAWLRERMAVLLDVVNATGSGSDPTWAAERLEACRLVLDLVNSSLASHREAGGARVARHG